MLREAIEQACKELGHRDYAVREQAMTKLRRIGRPALARLRELADRQGGDPEVFIRARQLAKEISDQAPPDRDILLKALAAVDVLEWMGSPLAEVALREVAAGTTDTDLASAAEAALERLEGRRP
jgi:hypothetical protein